MGRARARSIAILNWKGCFYERYELDPEVTSLEGNNGAGKTTVMIAVYTVLLPELRLLKFRNIGETGNDHDRGIASRLGETGPAYAVLELECGKGERLLAGVHLERTSDTRAVLNPFVIEGLEWDVSLAEVLLARTEVDVIPEPSVLRQQVLRLGGRLRECTPDEYFRELFDRGVLPLRMATYEERSRFNLMLHTSMFGGMSGALQNGLRDFLLREDRQLGDTAQKMRRILSDCRQSRRVVEHNRKLHVSVDGIFRAGWTMFCAGFHSTRIRAAELEQKYQELQVRADGLADSARRKAAAYDTAKTARDAAMERRLELAGTLKAAEEQLHQTKVARDLEARLAIARPLMAKAAADAVDARESSDARTRDRKAAEAEQAGLDAELREVDTHLADLEAAYQDIARKVGQYRAAVAAQEFASAALERPVDASNVSELVGEADAERAACAILRDQLYDRLQTEDQRAARFHRILEALERLAGERVPPDDAARRADQELGQLREKEVLAAETESLPTRIATARTEAQHQERVAKSVDALAAPMPAPTTPEAVQEWTASAQRAGADAIMKVAEATTAVSDLARSSEDLRKRAEVEGRRIEAWGRTQAAIAIAERYASTRPDSPERVETVRTQCTKNRDAARDAMRVANLESLRLARDAETLRSNGGQITADLESVRDAVGGSFVAEHLNDIPLEEAAAAEARLGPLATALMVDDVARAAVAAAAVRARPDTIWFVRTNADLPVAQIVQGEALVATGDAWRLTRPPAHPTVGRLAREREVARLEVASAKVRIEATQEGRTVEEIQRVLDALGRIDRSEIGAPDPEFERARLVGERTAVLAAHVAAGKALEQAKADLTQATKRRDGWNELLPFARLVGPPDHSVELRRLEGRLVEAKRARDVLRAVAADRRAVAEGVDHLLQLPLAAEAVRALTEEHEGHAGSVQRALKLLGALRSFQEVSKALAWGHLVDVLQDRRKANEQLRERQRALTESLEAAGKAVGRTRSAEETAAHHLRAAGLEEARTLQVVDALDAARGEIPVADASGGAVATAEGVVEAVGKAHREADADVQRFMEAAGRAEAEWERAEDDHRHSVEEADTARDEWNPWGAQWTELRGRAEVRGVLAPVMSPDIVAAFGDSGVGLARQANAEEKNLHVRLRAEPDGAPVLEAAAAVEARGLQYLETWTAVRRWLLERLPMDVGEAGDLTAALEMFVERLKSLEETLRGKEELLKTNARSVSDNLRARIRQEVFQVHKLNDELRSVGFGSIRGIELVAERVPSMDLLLDRLRDPDQQDLFRREMPIEEALQELFEEVGGGRIKGERLLDYREYLHVKVRVARAPSGAWEAASSRMSTGEAIGVGAAILVVVLTAWERDATILRSEQRSGTLRFLFLDEANRLSPNSLNVLFDLCVRLDLQLLIAAPDIARVARGTTYHLTRTEDDAGRETVVASGRRLVVST